MSTFETTQNFDGDAEQLMLALTEIDAIERWTPVPFEVDEGGNARLRAGEQLQVHGGLLGKRVSFEIAVDRADETGLSLRASGPFEIDVDYNIDAERGQVRARVETRARRLPGQLLASAANALLTAGALDRVLRQLVREVGESRPRALCLAA
jgi:hypothetical protein